MSHASYRTVLYDDGVAENISTLTKYPTVIIVQLMIVDLKLLHTDIILSMVTQTSFVMRHLYELASLKCVNSLS